MGHPTERDLELLKMPTIASQLPVQLDSGAKWQEFKAECKGCGRELPDYAVHGAVLRQVNSFVTVEASGVCHDCKLLTRFYLRLHDDMRITGPQMGSGSHGSARKLCWIACARSSMFRKKSVVRHCSGQPKMPTK